MGKDGPVEPVGVTMSTWHCGSGQEEENQEVHATNGTECSCSSGSIHCIRMDGEEE